MQFTIPKEGEPLFEGITPLLTDHLGTYRGSRFRGARCQFARVDEFPAVLEIVTQAARRIQQLGYFGPLGIDAMRYRTAEGQVRWRPLQDINARLTMGRLALGLERIVPELRAQAGCICPDPKSKPMATRRSMPTWIWLVPGAKSFAHHH